MNYRNERSHDDLLIRLATELSAAGRLDILEAAFELPRLGRLQVGRRCRDFDVELTLKNASLIIETKVDSDEDGRWTSPQEWQTERILRLTQSATSLESVKHYLFLTYGCAEFFGKPFRPGPACSGFRHIPLDRIVDLVRQAVALPMTGASAYREWLVDLEREQQMRPTRVGYWSTSLSSGQSTCVCATTWTSTETGFSSARQNSYSQSSASSPGSGTTTPLSAVTSVGYRCTLLPAGRQRLSTQS